MCLCLSFLSFLNLNYLIPTNRKHIFKSKAHLCCSITVHEIEVACRIWKLYTHFPSHNDKHPQQTFGFHIGVIKDSINGCSILIKSWQ